MRHRVTTMRTRARNLPNPTKRWEAQHGRKDRTHATKAQAQRHADDLNGVNGTGYVAYPCWWGDSPDAPAERQPHWHAGRVSSRGEARP